MLSTTRARFNQLFNTFLKTGFQEALAAVRELNGHNLKDQQLRCSFLPDNADTDKTVRTRPR